MLVDSHCHLDFPDFAEGVGELVARARIAGVGHFLTICTHVSQFDRILAVAESSPLIHCTVGTHPHQASEDAERSVTRQDIVDLSRHPKVVGIGETGLDYHYDFGARDDQRASFIRHVEAAGEVDLPLVIHTREAEEDTIDVLRRVGQGKVRGVMHCFTGTQKLAEAALDIGFYISFSGILTFKKSDDLRAVAATVPVDRLLVETDSPYLAPMPFRGKRNEPAYVVHTAEALAAVKGISKEALAEATTRNFFSLFSKAGSVA